MLIAEELEISLARVRLAHAPPDASRYGNPRAGGAQITGGSNSVQGAWEPLRTAGAMVRVMLIEAAAQEWRVAAAECRAQDGVVIHASSGRHLSYGQLSQRAAGLPLPKQVALKAPEAFKLIGRPLKRLDAAEKVDGRAPGGSHRQHRGGDRRPLLGGEAGARRVEDRLGRRAGGEHIDGRHPQEAGGC